jgi:nucleoid-associated protein YgaU
MFDPLSRYYEVEDAVFTMPDGRQVPYKRRRFVPAPEAHETLALDEVAAADRLDLISARTLGDPEQFWRICDANGALDPDELVEVGRRLRIPVPKR